MVDYFLNVKLFHQGRPYIHRKPNPLAVDVVLFCELCKGLSTSDSSAAFHFATCS